MEDVLKKRIKDLQQAVAWSHENGGLSNGKRICCHQEISASLQLIGGDNSELMADLAYIIPDHLEARVTHILGVIKNTSWQKQDLKF